MFGLHLPTTFSELERLDHFPVDWRWGQVTQRGCPEFMPDVMRNAVKDKTMEDAMAMLLQIRLNMAFFLWKRALVRSTEWWFILIWGKCPRAGNQHHVSYVLGWTEVGVGWWESCVLRWWLWWRWSQRVFSSWLSFISSCQDARRLICMSGFWDMKVELMSSPLVQMYKFKDVILTILWWSIFCWFYLISVYINVCRFSTVIIYLVGLNLGDSNIFSDIIV